MDVRSPPQALPLHHESLWQERLTPLRYNTYYENKYNHEVRWLEPKRGSLDVPNQLEQTLPPHINFGMPVTLTGTDMHRCQGVSGTLEDFDSDRCIVRLADALGSRYVAVKLQEHNKLIPLRRNTCVRVAEDGPDGEVWLVTQYDEEIQTYRLCSLVDLHRDASTVEDELRCLEVHARGVLPVSSFPDVEK
eukprot:1076964-Amphidinium_carterae.1